MRDAGRPGGADGRQRVPAPPSGLRSDMPSEVPGDRSAHVDALQAFARERLGMEIQAISHCGHSVRSARAPEVWHLLTEAGTFWLADRDEVLELFPAMVGGYWRSDAMRCRSPRQAARRFLALHP